jgi:protein-S-isoprenylcysteine O-methyltransferase Ste14
MAFVRTTFTRFGRPLGDALLVVLLLGFAIGNLDAWRRTGRPTGLGATGFEVMTAAFCVGRSKPLAVTGDWLAWPAALLGAFLMLLARPVTGDSRPAWEAVQMLGLLVAALSLGVLRHSFGLVAANRGIKTSGLYRVVRHPAYLGYFVTWFGYAGENPTLRNIALLVVATGFQLLRIRQEEAVLSLDAGYRNYRARVRHRLVPFVY